MKRYVEEGLGLVDAEERAQETQVAAGRDGQELREPLRTARAIVSVIATDYLWGLLGSPVASRARASTP